jgi:WD40 repeat protein
VLASARGQVAWLDLVAPRPTPLTQLVRPAYAADVAAAPGVSFAVASIVGAFAGTGGLGGDLTILDLESGASRPLLARQSDTESLDLPAIWPDGSGILYQRSNLRAAVAMPGQAQPQYHSRVEQIRPDGTQPLPLLDDARYPGPAPDGVHFAFVRSTSRGTGIFTHSQVDGSDAELVPPGQFLALAYPRFSPDGQHVAFAAISLLAPIGRTNRPQFTDFLTQNSAMAHGFPWEAWLVNADGSDLRQIADVQDDDPSVAWSPDGSQVLVYGGWGSFVVDAASGGADSLPFLAGYGSVAWLPD